jgi:hypothetical protein
LTRSLDIFPSNQGRGPKLSNNRRKQSNAGGTFTMEERSKLSI